ncbi:MAG: hypothetical protein KBC57_03080 [Neisseriaceae bacterium]|nr:hypothetical protein [Neisseriaceae bacterium]MBP6861322.1 hypothetical protein [Neisseriaceae bacterium]
MKRILLLSMGLACAGLAMATSPTVPKSVFKQFNAYAEKQFCSTITEEALYVINRTTYLAAHADYCGYGGNSLPRQVLTAMNVQTNSAGKAHYQVVAANVLEDLDIWGSVEKIEHDARTITVIMRQLGPEDARCCPSVLTQYTIEIGSWKLLAQKQL